MLASLKRFLWREATSKHSQGAGSLLVAACLYLPACGAISDHIVSDQGGDLPHDDIGSECPNFDNPPLEAAIRKELEIDDKTPLTADLLSIVKKIEVSNSKTLVGFECLPQLESLFLASNQARDLSPLSPHQSLFRLNFHRSEPVDFSTLTVAVGEGPAASLRELGLYDSKQTDLAGLERLRALTDLSLDSNALTDISPVAELSQLRELDLSDNQIEELGPLVRLENLEYLHVSDNSISSLQALDGMNRLMMLNANNNQLQELGGFSAPKLSHLNATANHITRLGDLVGLPGLYSLQMDSNQLQDISGLAGLSGLHTLSLAHTPHTPITTLESRAGLSELEVLDVSNTGVDSVEPLALLENVRNLNLGGSQVRDLVPLLNWAELPGSCRLLDVSELTISVDSESRVIPSFCEGSWQVEATEGWLCETVSCRLI